jgi:DNA repair protein RadC
MQTTYQRKPIVFNLDATNKRYVLTIHDLPNEEKPREKLAKLGPQSLSTAELLATILSKGTRKEDILSMTSRIMKEYGEKSIMSVRDPKILVRDLDIPLLHATQIVASAELGRRFYEKNDASLPTIRTASDVFEYVKDMRELSKEHLRGIYLNAHYKVIHNEIISIGTVDTNIIHPREVFRPALEYATVAVILVHNHPSGMTSPSDADIEVTKQLVEAGRLIGINLIDHVIVTKTAFASVPVEYS